MTSANHNTSAKHNDLMPTLKLEWVTPKISLMEAGDTDGKPFQVIKEGLNTTGGVVGPS